MINPIENRQGASINDWINALEKNGQSQLAEHLREDRAAGFEAARELGLPTPQFAVFRPLARFFKSDSLENIKGPADYIKKLAVNSLFVSIAPRKPDIPKYSYHPLSPDEVVPYITNCVSPEHRNLYNLVIGEYEKNFYGGVIIVKQNGRELTLEMVKGGVSTLTRGATPEFIVTRDKFTGFFHYSDSLNDNLELKQIIYSTINAIPHTDEPGTEPFESRHRKFTPGIFEFCLTGDKLKPQFIDYKKSE